MVRRQYKTICIARFITPNGADTFITPNGADTHLLWLSWSSITFLERMRGKVRRDLFEQSHIFRLQMHELLHLCFKALC